MIIMYGRNAQWQGLQPWIAWHGDRMATVRGPAICHVEHPEETARGPGGGKGGRAGGRGLAEGGHGRSTYRCQSPAIPAIRLGAVPFLLLLLLLH